MISLTVILLLGILLFPSGTQGGAAGTTFKVAARATYSVVRWSFRAYYAYQAVNWAYNFMDFLYKKPAPSEVVEYLYANPPGFAAELLVDYYFEGSPFGTSAPDETIQKETAQEYAEQVTCTLVKDPTRRAYCESGVGFLSRLAKRLAKRF